MAAAVEAPDGINLLEGPTFKITAGSGGDTATWNVPIALLVAHSAYFRQIHEGSIKTEHANEISFCDHHPNAIQFFLRYIYSKALDVSEPQPDSNFVVRSWFFGAEILAVDFKNYMMRFIYNAYALSRARSKRFVATQFKPIWNQRHLNPCLLRFMVDTIAQRWVYKGYIQEDVDAWHVVMNDHPDFRREVLDAIAGIGAKGSHGRNPKPLEAYLEKPENTTNPAKRPHPEDTNNEAGDAEASSNKVARLE